MPAISRSLNILARCGNQFRGSKLAHLGITAAQAPYILHICGSPGMSQEQLARALHVNPSNAARQLAGLEEKGYLQRSASADDKRQLLIRPSAKALAAEPLIREVNRQWNDYLTQGMDEEEQAKLEETLAAILARAIAWEESEGAQG